MGILSFFSRKRGAAEGPSGGPERDADQVADAAPVDAPSADAAPVSYAALVPMAELISNGDPRVTADIELLAEGYERFRAAHPEWCDRMFPEGVESDSEFPVIREVFTFWLAGYDTPFGYGSYVDWKEETEDVVASLQAVLDRLGVPVALDEVSFPGDEDTEEALVIIAGALRERGHALVAIDTESDSYHLYVVPQAELERLVALGDSVGFAVSVPA